MVKASIEIDVSDMIDGVITRFCFNDNFYSIVETEEPVKEVVVKGQGKRGPSETLVSKYIKDKDLKIFSVSQFFKDNPVQLKQKNRIFGYVSRLIADKRLVQMSNDKFRVVG